MKKIDSEKELDKMKDNLTDENMTYELISSVFKDNSKKIEIIQKLRPFFTLKVIPQREIEKVYSSVEKISPEKIDLIEEFKYEENKFDSNNLFEAKSKSIGLSNFDLDLSLNIFGHKQSGEYTNKDNSSDIYAKKKTKIHCIHSIVISLFRILIDFKDVKFTRQVIEELTGIENANTTDRKILLEKLVDKFGLYVPLELLVGGRINMSFDANNEEEKKEYHSILQKKFKAELGGGIFFVSAKAKIDYNKNNMNENIYESVGKIENLSKKVEGGDYMYKDDLRNWIKSFNINNLQIIEYKTLIPIYCFIPGLESKLAICLKNHEDIVLQEIYSLIEKDFKQQENSLNEGIPKNSNIWKVGITEEVYKSFCVYKKQITTKLIISKKENKTKKEDIICGEVPDGYIIVGWRLKTNSYSKPYNIDCKWEKQKDFNIIGSDCFKFNVSISEISEKNKQFNETMEIEWKLDIFCIYYKLLIPFDNNKLYCNNKKRKNNHYFINCDCFKRFDDDNNGECFYNKKNEIKIEELNKNYEEKIMDNLSNKISLEDCKNNKKLFKDLKEVELFTKTGFLNSFKIIKNNNYFDLFVYIKAPDNSPYKNGIYLFNIKFFDDKDKTLNYKAFIKNKIYHINISNENICNSYFFLTKKGEQSLLGSLFALFQTFASNNPDEAVNFEYALLYKKNPYIFNQKCEEWKKEFALKEFPKKADYLFENENESKINTDNNKIEVLCSLGRYIEINKKDFSLRKMFEMLGISDYERWSFIIGNNVYNNYSFIKESIIDEIKILAKVIIFPKTLCG